MPFRTIFSHSRSEHFGKQNTMLSHTTYNIFFQSCKHSIEFSKFWITLCTQHRTEKCNPSFFYYVYAALWRFDMHDILLDCQLLLLWFLVSSTATTNYYFAWNYTLWKISKRQLFFPYLSLSLFLLMTTPNSFSRWHRADLWLVKTLSKLSMFNCVHCLQYLNRQVPFIIHQKQPILVQDITST